MASLSLNILPLSSVTKCGTLLFHLIALPICICFQCNVIFSLCISLNSLANFHALYCCSPRTLVLSSFCTPDILFLLYLFKNIPLNNFTHATTFCVATHVYISSLSVYNAFPFLFCTFTSLIPITCPTSSVCFWIL